MILLYAIAAGLLAGLARAWITRRGLHFPEIRFFWVAPAAFLPQYLAFQFPATRRILDDDLAALILVGTQLILVGFVWVNRGLPGFWFLGLGLALNLLVIALNGGFMPISPEMVFRLAPEASPGSWQVGERLGSTKDIVLPAAGTHLEWLSDRFLLNWGSTTDRVAFSLGDVMIAFGAFWFFLNLSTPPRQIIFEPLKLPQLPVTQESFSANREQEYGD
jgi:hypothetical protein